MKAQKCQNGLNVLEQARAANASHEVIDVVWEHYLRTNRKKITVAQKNKEMVAAARGNWRWSWCWTRRSSTLPSVHQQKRKYKLEYPV